MSFRSLLLECVLYRTLSVSSSAQVTCNSVYQFHWLVGEWIYSHKPLATCCNWRASVASETLTGVKMKKSGMFVYLYICMDVRKAFLYFDPRVFVLVRLSTPSQIALNRILWFIDQYPYHPRN